MPPGGTPCSAWKIAEFRVGRRARHAVLLEQRQDRGPPAMSVSLFASAMSLPALIASTVGSSPAQPTMPVTTTSASGRAAAAAGPSFADALDAAHAAAASASLSAAQLTSLIGRP